MALQRQLADGTEYPCHKCGRAFRPGEMKYRRSSGKPGMPGTFTIGGKAWVWVHTECAPTRHKQHGRVKIKR